MPISVQCTNLHSFQVPSKFEGKTVRCPTCGVPTVVEEEIIDLSIGLDDLAVSEDLGQPLNQGLPSAHEDPFGLNDVSFEVPSVSHAVPMETDWANLPSAMAMPATPTNYSSQSEKPSSEQNRKTPRLHQTNANKLGTSNKPRTEASNVPSNVARRITIMIVGGVLGLALSVGMGSALMFLFTRSGQTELASKGVDPNPPEPIAKVIPNATKENSEKSENADRLPAPSLKKDEPLKGPSTPPADAKKLEPGPTDLSLLQSTDEYSSLQLGYAPPLVAYNSATGRLASTDYYDRVHIYDIEAALKGKATPRTTYRLGGVAMAMCDKQWQKESLLLVACNACSKIDLINLARLDTAKSIYIPAGIEINYLVSPQDNECPYVFFYGKKGERKGIMGRLDLTKDTIDTVPSDTNSPFTVSYDGKKLYTILGAKTWEELTAIKLLNDSNSGFRISQDLPPFQLDGMCFYNGGIYPQDFKLRADNRPVRSSENFRPVAFLENQNLCLGINSQELIWANANDLSVLKKIKLIDARKQQSSRLKPHTFGLSRGQRVVESKFPRGFADNVRKFAIVVEGDQVLVANSANEHPKKPFIQIQHDISSQVEFDEEVHWKITSPQCELLTFKLEKMDWVQNRELDIIAKNELNRIQKLANQSLKYENHLLTWRPTAEAYGNWQIRITGRIENEERELVAPFRVVPKRESFPFILGGIEPNAVSSKAFVWGANQPNRDLDRQHVDQDLQCFVGIYDVVDHKLESFEKFPFAIRSACFHGNTIAVLDVQSRRIATISPKALKILEQTTCTDSGRLVRIFEDKVLVTSNGRLSSAQALFQLPGLTRIKNVESFIGIEQVGLTAVVGRHALLDGVVYENDFLTPKVLVCPTVFRQSRPKSSTFSDGQSNYDINRTGSQLFALSNPNQNSDLPRIGDKDVRFTQNGCAVLAFRKENSLGEMGMQGVSFPYGDAEKENVPLDYASGEKGQLFLVADGKLVQFQLPKDQAETFAFPLNQSTFAFKLKDKVKVSYNVPDAKEYKLRVTSYWPSNGDARSFPDEQVLFENESKDGNFTIELSYTKPLFDHVWRAVSESWAVNHSLGPNDSIASGIADSEKTPDKMLRAYVQEIAPEFKRLTKRAPAGVPALVFAVARAVHRDGEQRAGFVHCFLVELPVNEVMEANQEANRKANPSKATKPGGKK